MTFPKLEPTTYQQKVYRNIFTCSPSQYILDDICDADEFALVDSFIQETSEIDHNKPQLNRPFQYGCIESHEVLRVFQKHHWNVGRFGDGKNYGVWYAAENDLTTIYEASWVAYKLGKDNVLNCGKVYTTDRVLYEADVSTKKAIDLTNNQSILPQLIDSNDYSYCQTLGKKLHENKFELLRTPSARRIEGVCTPILYPHPIQKISRLFDFKIFVNPNEQITVGSPRHHLNFTIHASQLTPYVTTDH